MAIQLAGSAERLAATYESYRPLLFSIAYRMTGSAMEAEDILQDGYLRFSGFGTSARVQAGGAAGSAGAGHARHAGAADVESLRSYLSTIVVRLSLDHLKSARAQREQYVGPWLPEPVLTERDARQAAPDPADERERRETVSLAFLVLLEALSPEERAVLVLHEVFEYPHDEIARMLEKTPAACRQILRRARLRLEARRGENEGTPNGESPAETESVLGGMRSGMASGVARYRPSREEQERLVARFIAACERGDVQALAETLAADVVSVSDGGGKTAAARRPIVGREAVVRFIFGLLSKAPPDFRATVEEVNGAPAVISWAGESMINVSTFEVRDGAIAGMKIVVNPDKLAYLHRQLRAEARPLVTTPPGA